MKTKHIIGSAVVVAGIIAASAIAQSNPKTEPVTEATSAAQTASTAKDDLDSSYGSRERIAPLKGVERAWLHQMIAEGKIRLATQADKDAWLKVAQSKKPGQKLRMMDAGRTFVILDAITIPSHFPNGERMTSDLIFIVASGVPFPNVNGGVGVYDTDSGGWYQSGGWDDGEKRGRGDWPHKFNKGE